MKAEKGQCKTCAWYEPFSGVCCNGNSEHRAGFMDEDSGCREWEGERNEFTINDGN